MMSHHHYPPPPAPADRYASPHEPQHPHYAQRSEPRSEPRGYGGPRHKRRSRSPERRETPSHSVRSYRERSPPRMYGAPPPVMGSHYNYDYYASGPHPESYLPEYYYPPKHRHPSHYPDSATPDFISPPDAISQRDRFPHQSAYTRGRFQPRDHSHRDHSPNHMPAHDVASPDHSRRRSSHHSVDRSHNFRQSHGESNSRRSGSHQALEEPAFVSPPHHSSPTEHHHATERYPAHSKTGRSFNDNESSSQAPRDRRDSRNSSRGRGSRFSRPGRDNEQRQYPDPASHEHVRHLDTIQIAPSHHSQSIIQSINPVPSMHETGSASATPVAPTTTLPIIRLTVSTSSDSRPVHPVTGASRKRRSEGSYQPRHSSSSPNSAKRYKSDSHDSNNQSINQLDDHSNGYRPTKCAYVHLVMKGDSYIPGALVSAYSIRLTNTKHSLVCMVTDDVTEEGRSRLRVVFDQVIEVPFISAHVGALKTAKQTKMYESWVDVAFTKWNCLKLVDYFKVMFIDADKIILANIDHLFELNAPAATFSSPWSQPFVKRSVKKNAGSGLQNPYIKLDHGDVVESKMIELGLTKNSFVLIGTMVLLEPSMRDYNSYLSMLARSTPDRPFGYPSCHSMMDEQSLTVLYEKELHRRFTFIHQRYNFISWHREWLDDNDLPYVYHYFSTKPWILKRDSFIDCETWWSLAECLLHDVSRYDTDKLEWIKGCFDQTQFTTKGQEGCAWCHASELEEPIWKSHSVFDHEGKIACPELQRREETK